MSIAASPSKIRRVQVIVNPAAGREEAILAPLNAVFHDAAIAWDTSITNAAGDAERFAREAAAAGVDAVVVYGGDGTVSEVISGLEGTRVPMAILRGGTGNVLAEELHIPVDLAEAASIVTRPHRVQSFDAALLDGERFVVRVGIGLEADTVEGATREAKDRLGVLAYPLSAVKAATDAPCATYRLVVDGEEHVAEGVTCIIANSAGLGRLGLTLAPDIRIDDGLLDVAVLKGAEVANILRVAGAMAASSEPPGDVIARWKCREVRVDAEPRQSVVRDGETAGETPVEARILPAVARVLVPAQPSSAA